SGIRGATIGGGGLISDAELYFGGASPNQISAHYGVIGGGLGNVAGEAAPIANPLEEPPPQYNHNFHDGAYYITNGIASGVLTGVGNHARGHYSSIGGGFSNRIERFNESAFIGGGQENSIRDVSFPTEGGVQYFLVTGATIS